MVEAVFFDVNETLLDLGLLKEKFDKHFNDEYIVKYWFTKLLHTSNTIAIGNDYEDFGKLSEVVLENVFHERGKKLTKETKDEILGSFRKLSAYKDVKEALKILKENSIRVIGVSNSSLEMMKDQLTNAGLMDLLDDYYSVDAVKKYKPFTDIYRYVAKEENLAVEKIVMVASHDWDLLGAKKAGLKTAYIERKEEIYNPFYPKADIRGADLVEMAYDIIKMK